MLITLVGIGSRASGDDAVGLMLVEHAASWPGVAAHVWEDRDALDVAAGLVELGEADPGGGAVILVDCADMGLAPGCWRIFDGDAVVLGARAGGASVHGAGLADGLALAQALGFVRPLRILGIQPFDVRPGRLTPSLPMATRLPSLRVALREEIDALRGVPDGGEGPDELPRMTGRAS